MRGRGQAFFPLQPRDARQFKLEHFYRGPAHRRIFGQKGFDPGRWTIFQPRVPAKRDDLRIFVTYMSG